MPLTAPLPETIQSKLGQNKHPGLALDKYVESWESGVQKGKLSERVQKPAIERVVELSQAEPPGLELAALRARRAVALNALGAALFRCQTTGPLTLHLARASALENAGICLHPLYGFTYFPGSGLKGMARAYAETVWLPAQFNSGNNGQPIGDPEEQKATEAWGKIEHVFGWAPFSDIVDKGTRKPWKPGCVPERGKDDSAHSGSVVFQDAWPEQWPRLYMDILNNHHADYYQGKDAPGDWENPRPVNFLAVVPGQTFSFAVSKRAIAVDDSLVALAKEWLIGALCHLGAGAKTAAGYGCFKPVEGASPPLNSPARATFQTQLELVTPAFLAGAKQQKEDCDLRTATLRGLLRWWWRTMHAGFVDVPTLRQLETAVWGDTNSGGAVRVTLEPENLPESHEYNYKDRFRPKPEFKKAHGLEDVPNSKTTQGLFYASYGMDEFSRGQARHRWYVPAGSRWRVTLTARRASYEERNTRGEVTRSVQVGAPLVLAQAHAALWLLTHFGAVGSKARKGFGSFVDIPGMSLEECKKAAAEFREACGIPTRKRASDTASLEEMLPPLEILTPWKDPWFALDQIGFSAKLFAQVFAHNPEKLGLGLPRKIHGPKDDRPMPNQDAKSWRPGKWLGELHPKCERGKEKDVRDASPAHYHLAKLPDGSLAIRVAAFPARYLPDPDTNRKFLGQLLKHLKDDLEKRVRDLGAKGRQKTTPAPALSTPAHRTALPGPRFPRHGDRVAAELIDDPKGKGRRFARHIDSRMKGNIQNPGDIPTEAKVGDKVQLIVAICTPPDQIQFRWPGPESPGKPTEQKPPGGGGKDRPRR